MSKNKNTGRKVFIGFDNGAGDNKGTIIYQDTGEIVNVKYSSIMAKASQQATDMPLFEKERYYVGDAALYAESDKIIDFNSYEPLEKMSPLSLHYFLEKMNIDMDDVLHISIGLSFAHLAHGKKFLKRMMKFKVNDKVYDFSDRMTLIPQGVGAKHLIDELYKNGPRTYLILDGGFLTIDSVDVIDGVVRAENVSAVEGGGVNKIARNIQELVSTKFNENISIKEAKEILSTKTYFISGDDHDLSEDISKFISNYGKYFLNKMEEKHQREFKKYRAIYFVGGGAHFITPDRGSMEVLDEPEFANSKGGAIKARNVYLEKHKS